MATIWYPANTWLKVVLIEAALLITGTAFGLMRIWTARGRLAPTMLLAPRVIWKSPLCVGVPESNPVLTSTDKPAGSPLAPYAVMAGLVATSGIGVMGLPTVPVTAGESGTAAVTTGIRTGLMVSVRTNGAPGPAALVARKVVVEIPLTLGEPLMAPVLASRLSPAGNTLGATTA